MHPIPTRAKLDEECFTEDRGADYRGSVAKTKEGLECLSWAVKEKNNGAAGKYWPGETRNGVGDHNLCRNPDGEAGPWCYTVKKGDANGGRWALCDVGSPAKACLGTWSAHVVTKFKKQSTHLHARACAWRTFSR